MVVVVVGLINFFFDLDGVALLYDTVSLASENCFLFGGIVGDVVAVVGLPFLLLFFIVRSIER